MQLLERLLELEAEYFLRETTASFPVCVSADRWRERITDADWRKRLRGFLEISFNRDVIVLRHAVEQGSLRDEAGWRSDPITFHARYLEVGGERCLSGRFVSYWPMRVAWLVVLNAMIVGAIVMVTSGVWRLISGDLEVSWTNIPPFAIAIGAPLALGLLVRWDRRHFEVAKARFIGDLDRFTQAISAD